MEIYVELVEYCLKELGRNKSDRTNLSSNCFVLASSVPISKPLKDPSNSDSYRPIALAPNLSKVIKYTDLVSLPPTLYLAGFSTDLYTGALKNVVSEYCMAVQMFLVVFWVLVKLSIELTSPFHLSHPYTLV